MIYRQQAKYANQKITVVGETFDSKREFRRYQELILLQKAGRISDLRRQVPFELIPSQREPDHIGKRGGVKKRLCHRAIRHLCRRFCLQDGREYGCRGCKGRTDERLYH